MIIKFLLYLVRRADSYRIKKLQRRVWEYKRKLYENSLKISKEKN